jgi:nucleotidyltransferase substrate binding protein (TIGR01987 family)
VDRIQERLDFAKKAQASLRELLAIRQPDVVQRDAILLRFAFAAETTWKAAQGVLQTHEALAYASPKECVRASLRAGLLDARDADSAMIAVEDRNLVVHTYNEALALEVLGRVRGHAEVFGRWLDALRRRS